jgi:hypothetical protein
MLLQNKHHETTARLRDLPLNQVAQQLGLRGKREGGAVMYRNDALAVNVRGQKFFDHKSGVGGGGAIDLVKHVLGCNFSAAVTWLGGNHGQIERQYSIPVALSPKAEKESFTSLLAGQGCDERAWPKVRKYLTVSRRLPPLMVDELHRRGDIYANAHRTHEGYPNPAAVFLHRSWNGHVWGASLRDCLPHSIFRQTLGNKQTAWFAVGNLQAADRIAAVESPIDAMSYHALAGQPADLAVVSCAGSYVPVELMRIAYLQRPKTSFIVALDNDAAGERGWYKAWDDTTEWTGFKLENDLPKSKDWNQDLFLKIEEQQPLTVQP